MQSPNHRPGLLDMLSQHAVINKSQVRKVRHTIPACIVQTSYPSMHCIMCTVLKRLQKPKTADKLTQQNRCRTRRDLHKKSKQLQHLGRLGKAEAWDYISRTRNKKTNKLDINCNQHLLVIAPLIEGEPELTSTENWQYHIFTKLMFQGLICLPKILVCELQFSHQYL